MKIYNFGIYILILIISVFLFSGCSRERVPFDENKAVCGYDDCHKSSPLKEAIPLTGKHSRHISKHIICDNCHKDYLKNKNHKNGVLDASGQVCVVFFDSLNPGASWDNLSGKCSNLTCHGKGSADISWFDELSGDCKECHAPGSAIDHLANGKHAAHVTAKQFSCDKCHLDYRNNVNHINGISEADGPSGSPVYFDSTNPSPGAWTNSSGTCSDLACHGISVTVDWYGATPWTLPSCSTDCHNARLNGRRQVTGAAGDFGSNSALTGRHVAGSGDPTADQCMVCHAMGSHMGGTVMLKHADTAAAIVYDSANPASAESFCLSCHDADGSAATYAPGGNSLNPFGDGSVLGNPPYPYSLRVASSWAKAYGHGSASRPAGKKATCLGSGQPGTGCHGKYDSSTGSGQINAHGSANVAILSRRFDYNMITMTYNASSYDLCFSCHASYPGFTKEDILGVKAGGLFDKIYGYMDGPRGKKPPYTVDSMKTRFADHNGAVSLCVSPSELVYDQSGHIWVGCPSSKEILKVDSSTGHISDRYTLTFSPNLIALAGDYIVVLGSAAFSAGYLARITISSGSVQEMPALGAMYEQSNGLIWDGTSVWVSSFYYGRLIKIDISAMSVLKVINYVFHVDWLGGMAWDGGNIWIINKWSAGQKELLKFNTVTESSTLFTYSDGFTGAGSLGIVAAGGFIWLANTESSSVSKINISTGAVDQVISAGNHPSRLFSNGTDLWVSNNYSADVMRYKMSDGSLLATVSTSSIKPWGLAGDGQSIWVGNNDTGTGGLERISIAANQTVTDPYGKSDKMNLHHYQYEMNLHWYHMSFIANYRGSTSYRGYCGDNCHWSEPKGRVNTNCVTCHDVHGSNTAASALYDEIGYTRNIGAWGAYGQMAPERYIVSPGNDLDTYPTYCIFNCHQANNTIPAKPYGQGTRAWYNPVME